jgi:ABC-2 type transport system ATP-binding protein
MGDDVKAIEIRSLHKTFRTGLRRKRIEALRGLDLDVIPGQIFGFLGPNGAGKTTTIKILVGLLRPDSGKAYIFGKQVGEAGSRRRIAFVPELPDFYDYLRPGEFLNHCGRLSGLEAGMLKKKIPELLQRVGLDPEEKRQMRKFSKGMLQRVGIAQALLADPDLYILDEPMGGLDPLGRRWVKDLILELAQAGKTVFFSSHVLGEAEAVCDRVAFLHHGRMVAQGPLREVLAKGVPGAHTAGSWEILVEGGAADNDREVVEHTARVERSGPDTLLVPKGTDKPDAFLLLLLKRGHSIRSVNQQRVSLEDAFIRTVDDEKRGKEK